MTVHLPKWFLGAALAGALSFMLGSDATGVTSWKDFGSGWARAGAQGSLYEHPYVSLDGTTTTRPVAVRFVVTSWQAPRNADLHWYLTCWRGYNYGSRSGSQENVRLPYTRQFTLPIANPDYCSLDVSAFMNGTGRVVVKLQAKYP